MDNMVLFPLLVVIIGGIVMCGAVIASILWIMFRIQKIHIEQTTSFTALANAINELRVENMMTETESAAGTFPPQGSIIFRSADGRYMANSLEGLVQQMINDPKSGLSDSELDALRKFFERLTGEDDEGDSKPGWK